MRYLCAMQTTEPAPTFPCAFPLGDLRLMMFRMRKHAGLTQAKMSAKLGVHQQTIRNWEGGKVKPTEANLTAFCEACGIETSYSCQVIEPRAI